MRILLIEDEKAVATFIKKGLEEEHYSVDTASDGEAGLQMFHNGPYDLAIVDVMLPKLDGFSLCQTIRKLNTTVPILILTARTRVEDRVHGLDIGADDYLIKPFAFSELSARVRALLRRKAPLESIETRVGNVVLDQVRHSVMVSDKIIDLTPREFSLLEYLMRHTGYTVTRTMIAEQVWSLNFHSITNVVDVYINHLRKKLNEKNANVSIQTVRGIGYSLREQ